MGETKKKKEKKKKRRDRFDSVDTTMSLGDHLEELRARLILAIIGLVIGTIISFCFGTRIIQFIETPYSDLSPNKLIVIGVADSFIAYMKISLIAGLIFSSPWVFYQLWMFVAAGLYPHERRYVRIAVPFSVALFVTGALFFLFVVAPISLKFFLKFGEIIDVETSWTLQKYVSFITMLMLVFGIGFQTPIAILILTRTGLVSVQALRRSRKYVFLGAFIVAAVATPPDVVSQITLAIPLYGLFELGIVLSYFAQRRKKAREKAEAEQTNPD
jgi:sec-independent protein translocase protein TatC